MDQLQRTAAKVFGFVYLLSLALLMYVFPRFYAPYIVWDNGEETARRFIGHAAAIRVYLAGAFIYGIGLVVLLIALYLLLRGVNRGLALFAAISKLIYVGFWFIFVLEVSGALRMLGAGGSLRTFSPDALAALAGSQMDSSRDAYYIALVFNGLGSALFAWVFFRSRYIARVLALWGVVASLYEGFCGFAYLFRPNFGAALSPNYYELPAMTFELILCFWLLAVGFRSAKTTPVKPLVTAAG